MSARTLDALTTSKRPIGGAGCCCGGRSHDDAIEAAIAAAARPQFGH
jgi:hypothetical protein